MNILPCPFCGHDDVEIDEIELGIIAICCPECQTIGPHTDGEHSTEQAIAKWNGRGRGNAFLDEALNSGDGVYRP